MTNNKLIKIIFCINAKEKQILSAFYEFRFQKVLVPGGEKAFKNYNNNGYYSIPSICFQGDNFIKIESTSLDISKKKEIFRLAIADKGTSIDKLNSKYDIPPISYVVEKLNMIDLTPILMNNYKIAIIKQYEETYLFDSKINCLIDRGLYFVDIKLKNEFIIHTDDDIPLNIIVSSSSAYIKNVLMSSDEIEFI